MTIYWFDLYITDTEFPDVHNFLSKGNVSFQKTHWKFSRMGLDQIHEHNKPITRGYRGASDVSKKVDESALICWETCRLTETKWDSCRECKITSLNLTIKNYCFRVYDNCDRWFRSYGRKTESFISDRMVVSNVPISQKITLNNIEIWNHTDTGQLKCKVEFSPSKSAFSLWTQKNYDWRTV